MNPGLDSIHIKEYWNANLLTLNCNRLAFKFIFLKNCFPDLIKERNAGGEEPVCTEPTILQKCGWPKDAVCHYCLKLNEISGI